MVNDIIQTQEKALCDDVLNYIKNNNNSNGVSGFLIKKNCSITKKEVCLAIAYLLGKGKIKEEDFRNSKRFYFI